MKNLRKRGISLLLLFVLCVISVSAYIPSYKVVAASKYITVEDFIEYTVKKLKLAVDKSSETPYIDAAMKAGILKKGDFKDYTAYLTRTDCAVIANRVDKYLYGEYFGYPKEVYEFLKGCNYLKGKFYYNVKGDLYPEGMNSIRYRAKEFLDDVVKPIITPYFTFKRELGAWYHDTWDENGNHKDEYVMIGYAGTSVYVDPMNEDNSLIQAWKKIVAEERKIKAVYDKRISDLNKIAKKKRQDVAEVVAKGIIKGYSNGKYVQNRSFKGSNKITASGAKNVIKLAIDKDKRAPISPDGQLIRTTNLPKNAADYPYILECFPNEFYEMRYRFESFYAYKDGTMPRSSYSLPYEVNNDYIHYIKQDYINADMYYYQYYDTIIEKVETYLNCVFDVDYRTVGKKWINKVVSVYKKNNKDALLERINKYLTRMKKNHVVVEKQLITVEPSTMYRFEEFNSFYVRCYVKYRITANTVKVEDDNALLFGSVYETYLVGLKNGQWRYGYYDIPVESIQDYNNINYLDFGVSWDAGISDEPLRGSK